MFWQNGIAHSVSLATLLSTTSTKTKIQTLVKMSNCKYQMVDELRLFKTLILSKFCVKVFYKQCMSVSTTAANNAPDTTGERV